MEARACARPLPGLGLGEIRSAGLFRLVSGAERDRLPPLNWRLLVQIRLGDEPARHAFLEAWGPVVDQEVRRYAAKGGDPEELAAEGYLALWEAANQYDPQRHKTSPERYIANHIHKRIRRRYRAEAGYTGPVPLPLEAAEPQPHFERRFVQIEQRLDLAAAVGALPAVERATLDRYLRLAEGGLGPDEAARVLARQEGGSFAAWKKRLERLRRKVRERLR
jgi:RNA polymerase sigma factor (sigma-70 family)